MDSKKFVLISSYKDAHHCIAVSDIRNVSPRIKDGFKSAVTITDRVELYSSDTVEEIYNKIKDAQL